MHSDDEGGCLCLVGGISCLDRGVGGCLVGWVVRCRWVKIVIRGVWFVGWRGLNWVGQKHEL